MLPPRRLIRSAALAIALLVPIGAACSSDDGNSRVGDTPLQHDTGDSQNPGSPTGTSTSLSPATPQTSRTVNTALPGTPQGGGG